MPTVAIIDGVQIQFYPDEHPPPHFHAKIAEFVAQIRIDPPEILAGTLPPNKRADILDWASAHRQELMEAWIAMGQGQHPRKIR